MSSTQTYLPLHPGESPVAHAPLIQTQSGSQCIPQHYLTFQHTLETIENIVSQITYSSRYLVFVSQDEASIFIQIGVVGPDNYKSKQADKIVFGRRWRVEPNLPTSEIIQTVFLALKKAREHEIREQFVVTQDTNVSTPFNCHHDLPLMAHLAKSPETRKQSPSPEFDISELLKSVCFDGVKYSVLETVFLASGDVAITLEPTSKCDDYTSVYGSQLSFISPSLNPGIVLHNLIAALIGLSDRHVDETFTFDGFARFSHSVDPFEIAEMSAKYRSSPSKFINPNAATPDLLKAVTSMNYDVDQKRIPTLSNNTYGNRVKASLSAYGITLP